MEADSFINSALLLFNRTKVITLLTFFAINLAPQNFNQNNPTDDQQLTFYLNKGSKVEETFPDSAIYYYQTALTIIKNNDTKGIENQKTGIVKTDLLTRIGRIFHLQSKYTFAEDYYRRAIFASEEIKHDSLIAENEFNLAEIFLENGGYEDAVNLYTKSITGFEKINYQEGIFWSSIGLGIVYKNQGNTLLAKKYYEEARQIAEDKNDFILIGICNNNIGNLYNQTGDYENALKYLRLALTSFEKGSNKKFMSDCLESIGNVYNEYKDYKKAIEYFQRSTVIAEELNDNYRLLSRYANLASSFEATGADEQALMYYSKTLELAQSVGDKSRLSEILILLAGFYTKKSDFQNSVDYLNQSLSISNEIGDTVSIAKAYSSLAEVYLATGDIDNAYVCAHKAFILARDRNLLKTELEASLCLSEIFKTTNNFKEAYKYFQNYDAVKDSLLNAERIKILEETEAKYNLEKLEKEKLEIENEALASAKRIQERNILIGLLALVIIISGLFFGRYFRKKRIEKTASERRSLQLTKKIDLLSSQLDAKNRELASKAIMISKNNKILEQISEDIEECLNIDDNKKDLRKLKNRLNNIYQEENWDDFLKHFNDVHPGFYKKLTDKFPELSSMEQKICAFLKMNLNTKEIAQINSHSVKSIEVARTRIRKKMGIKRTESLTQSIQEL